MERISQGPVSLLNFTVRQDDLANLHLRPPYQYFLVAQVFTADGEYLCTQLLGIDLRAVKYLERQSCGPRTADELRAADRERIQVCLDRYARFLVTKVTEAALGYDCGTGQKIQ